MGVFNFSSGKIEIINSNIDWFIVPKNVTLSYVNTTLMVCNDLNFFVEGKAEIYISN